MVLLRVEMIVYQYLRAQAALWHGRR